MRSRYLGHVRRVVVKVGSRLFFESPQARPSAIAAELATLRRERGIEAVVVSSGAIALGLRQLGLAKRPHELARQQAVAAVGQSHLMQNWEAAFATHGVQVGQVLITHPDFSVRARFLSARHVVSTLLAYDVVPIINENDTLAVDEIKFGDNDQLAALVTNLVGADALLMLTDVDGLHDRHPTDGGQRIALVRDIDQEAAPVAGLGVDGIGTGGMASKVKAAKIAAHSGVPSLVVPGARAHVIRDTLAGQDIGTLFVPSDKRLQSRKHWIAFGPRPRGAVVVDAGAQKALLSGRKSLLPSGITDVRGDFATGDAIGVLAPDGSEIARGLVAYSAQEVAQLKGCQSADIERILGYKYIDEVIHRDDLVVL